ncbi:MAG: hypothetical protein E6I32_19880 [Chloroflexi bacterium]|nr:MAG: hypothetical protein E6I32_19880 [Chloroflexota bacterium]
MPVGPWYWPCASFPVPVLRVWGLRFTGRSRLKEWCWRASSRWRSCWSRGSRSVSSYGLVLGLWITRSIGGLTGDSYGAIAEVVEVVALLVVVMVRA